MAESSESTEHYKAKLEVALKEMFRGESSGHDLHHLNRVYNLACHIQKKEGGNELVVGIAAFMHDVHRLMQNEQGKFVPPKDSLGKIEGLLRQVAFPEDQMSRVLHCVEFHEEYGFSKEGRTVTDLETLILQDADNLDAIGAIGVGRTFSYGGAHGTAMYDPEAPLDSESAYDEENSSDPSTIHHFYHKLLRLGDQMNTATGKGMAKARHDYMQGFVDQFLKEWKGEA